MSRSHTTALAPARRSGDAALTAYFERMARHDVLTAEQEIELAQEVERLEIDYWRALLTHPPAVPALATTLAEVDSEPLADALSPLCELARAAARRPLGKRRQARWDSLVDDLARYLRELDVDRELVRAADAAVHNLVGEGAGDALAQTPQRPPTVAWRRYLERVEAARAAQHEVKQRFVAANLRLVVTIARRYARGSRMPLIDLVQEGNIGLMRAVERFDHRRGFRFSTYASWWIRHAVGRARADKDKAVRIPVHMLDTCRTVARADQRIASREGRRATIAELADETGLSEQKVERARAQSTAAAMSLDRQVNDEDGRTFVDFLADDDARSPFDTAAHNAWSQRVPQLLASLSPLEAHILRWRFGLDGQPEQTLQTIGEHYNLSRERIRQIQQQALEKLRRRVPDHPLQALGS